MHLSQGRFCLFADFLLRILFELLQCEDRSVPVLGRIVAFPVAYFMLFDGI